MKTKYFSPTGCGWIITCWYLCCLTRMCFVNEDFQCWNDIVQVTSTCANPHQAPHDVIKRCKRVMTRAMDVSFNMGNSNWLYTLRSGSVDRDSWLLQALSSIEIKFLSSSDHWMKSACVELVERLAKMLVTGWARSNSRKKLGKSKDPTGKPWLKSHRMCHLRWIC